MKLPTSPQQEPELSVFSPPRGLRNPHLQSTLPTLWPWRLPVLWRSRRLRRQSQVKLFESADGVRLQAQCTVQGEHLPWVIIVHGWLGHAESNYVLSLATTLFDTGYNICRLNLRDHGDTEHLNLGLFHSCLLDEVIDAVRSIQQHYAIKDLSLAGFSLGGNFVLRVAARAVMAHIQLRKVVAICPALNPHASDAALASGLSMYRQHFLNKWKQILKRKERLFPRQYDFSKMLGMQSITELTDVLVRTHAGFKGARDYYDGYSLLGKTLNSLVTPAYVLLAKDDPIVPVKDVELLASNPNLHITLSEFGGHCGFMSSLSGKRWADEWAKFCLG